MEIKVPGIIGLSLIDYPNKLAGVIFLAGCNFRCPYCHNMEIIENVDQLECLELDYIFSEFRRRKKLLDAVVITGGEPTIWKDLPLFVKEFKNMGYLVKLDTNGYMPEIIREIINSNIVDFISMDIKSQLDEEKYSKASGTKVDINKIVDSIDIIKNSKVDYEFRTTLIDGFVDFEDIRKIVDFIAPVKKYYIQTANKEWEGFTSPPEDKIMSLVDELIRQGFKFIEIR